MRLIRVATASVSVKVGDFKRNADTLCEVIETAKKEGVHLLVTPELAVSGYSLEDRLFWDEIVVRSWDELKRVAEHTRGIGVFVGLPVKKESHLFNAGAFLCDGLIHGFVLKKYLPTYQVFYEARYWSSWDSGITEIYDLPAGDLIFELPFGKVSAEICEDVWSSYSPSVDRAIHGAEIICNLSASPFNPLKNQLRKQLILANAMRLKVIYIYSNLLGCDNSRLVFDGGGIIATPEGHVVEGAILSNRRWVLTSTVIDLDEVTRVRKENSTWKMESLQYEKQGESKKVIVGLSQYKPSPLKEWVKELPKSFYVIEKAEEDDKSISNNYFEQLYKALSLGLRDYYEKVGIFETFLVALSGGRDSALCLLLAVEAGKNLNEGKHPEKYREKVACIYLPHKEYSSTATRESAEALAKELEVPFKLVSIHEEAEIALKKAEEIVGSGKNIKPLTRQNLQARIRGAMMLNWANNVNGLLLVTSNLSESAVGYTTTGGDNEGGFSPIANVPKTVISSLLEYLAETRGIKSLEKILKIPPTAELAPNQTDEGDLMPYRVLDELIYLFAKQRFSLVDCWRVICIRFPEYTSGQLKKWTEDFAKRFVANQWKRDQHPVSLKVLEPDFDPKTGFRFPVIQSIDSEIEELKKAKL
ncbi:MAG TPA: NAD(+) synthase [Candidatus Hydrogenedens sp.]|nr:NAD(+) synthase [Candidatus Hydrogenedens sp.]HPP58579.1 NAD(+) synthase [Candidatus Hydrogenedens sp.]